MRIVWLMGWLALTSACSSHIVRCDRHLRPINMTNGTVTVPASSANHP
jgi:hypothetical protein